MASWRDFFVIKKDNAENNNYKLDLFNTVSQTNEIANMSVLKDILIIFIIMNTLIY